MTLLIVAVTYACSKPNAMVVKLKDTIVARVAMRTPRRSEDLACLTKFESVESASS